MRKRLISICTVVILGFCICGCAKTVEDALATETENAGPQDTKAENEKTAPMSDDTEQEMYTYIIDDNRAVITGLQAEYENFLQENMVIPDTLGGYSVAEIGDHAFEHGLFTMIPDFIMRRVFAGLRNMAS